MSYGHISVIVTCDTCGFYEDVSTGDYDQEDAFAVLEEEVKRAGWQVDSKPLYPRHTCKECLQQQGKTED